MATENAVSNPPPLPTPTDDRETEEDSPRGLLALDYPREVRFSIPVEIRITELRDGSQAWTFLSRRTRVVSYAG
jgi:hypothetical protein